MDRPSFTAHEAKRPYESAYCEGCKYGHCSKGYDIAALKVVSTSLARFVSGAS
jgi:hypothetical protein